MTVTDIAQTTYRLGNVVFAIKNCQTEIMHDIDALLPKAESDSSAPLQIDMSGAENLRELINVVLKEHEGVIWIDAGCLLSPSGKRFFIAGQSSSGKSTLTMAMALGYGWKVITEDLLLIDPSSDRIITLATPFSFKPGTVELLKETIQIDVGSLIMGEWLPLHAMAAAAQQPAAFDFAILLGERDKSKPLESEEVSPIYFFRNILGCSNLLHVAEGADKMVSYLSGRNFHAHYGTLAERIDMLRALDGKGQSAV